MASLRGADAPNGGIRAVGGRMSFFHMHKWVTVTAVDSTPDGGMTKNQYTMCAECYTRMPELLFLERGEWWVTA